MFRKNNELEEELEIVQEEAVVKQKKKLPGWVIIPILGGVLLLFFIVSLFAGGQQQKETALQTAKIKKGDVKDIYNASGTVESEKTKVFYSPVNAPIQELKAKVGEAVKAGDMLVSFDITNLERDNQKSDMDAQAAKYTNQDAVEQAQRAEQTAAQTEAQTAAAINSLQEQVQQKQAEVNNLQQASASAAGNAAANAAKLNEIQQKMNTNQNEQTALKAKKENAERQLINMPQADPQYEILQKEAQQATNDLSAFEIEYRQLEAQKAQYATAGGGDHSTALLAATQELESLKKSLEQQQNSASVSTPKGLTSGQVNNMKVSENLTEMAKLTTEELLAKGREGIKAEFNGVISDVKAAAGSPATQGLELFTVVSNEDVVVKLEISANDFDNIAIGNKAEIKLGKKIYNGTLTALDKIALPNKKGNSVIGAKVRIENPDDQVYIGVNAKVSMVAAEKKNVLCLPNEAVNTATDGDFVYIIEKGVVKKQKVELGVSSSDKTEIVKGLKEGTEVVTDTSFDIKEGMPAAGKE